MHVNLYAFPLYYFLKKLKACSQHIVYIFSVLDFYLTVVIRMFMIFIPAINKQTVGKHTPLALLLMVVTITATVMMKRPTAMKEEKQM